MTEAVHGEATANTGASVEVLGPRVLATLVDAVVIFIGVMALMLFQWLISLGAALAGLPEGVQIAVGLIGLLINLAIPVLVVAYYVYFEGRKGQTLGKKMSGIKVIREDTGEVPGMQAALIRTLLRVIDGFCGYLVGFLVANSSEKRQRLGDMVAHTLVVRS